MKTSLLLLCILGIITTVIFTNMDSPFYELLDTTNRHINGNKQSNSESLKDHATHKDYVRINGRTSCEKRQVFYYAN
jgi:hypothetical protein